MGENVAEGSEKADIRRSEFKAIGDAGKALVPTTPGFKEINFYDSGFSARGIIISVSAIPQHEMGGGGDTPTKSKPN